jgi:hypothetical protein
MDETMNAMAENQNQPVTGTENGQELTIESNTLNNGQTESKKKRKVSLLPFSDVDKLQVTKVALPKWKENPQITLVWKTVEEFELDIQKFEGSCNDKTETKVKRTPTVKKLSELNRKIDKMLIFIKDALKDIYGKNTFQSYFPEFGIEKASRGYLLPTDQTQRGKSLTLLVDGITNHQLQGLNSSLEVWQSIKDEYFALLDESTTGKTTESEHVGDKVIYRPIIKQTLEALAGVIRWNYPENYENVLRSWGFMRETY